MKGKRPSLHDEKIRSLLVKGILTIFGFTMLISLAFGVFTRDYEAMEKVALFEVVLAYFLGRQR